MYKIDYTQESLDDLNQIAEYLAERSVIAPLTVLGKIRRKIDDLLIFPNSGQVFGNYPRYRRVSAGRYIIFYEVDEEKEIIAVARILHSARQIERLLVEEKQKTKQIQERSHELLSESPIREYEEIERER